jgi:hypothetical protein
VGLNGVAQAGLNSLLKIRFWVAQHVLTGNCLAPEGRGLSRKIFLNHALATELKITAAASWWLPRFRDAATLSQP